MKKGVAVVTGGAKGIGRACCEKLLSLGYEVVFFDVNDSAAEAFIHDMRGSDLYYMHCDVSASADIELACNKVLGEHGNVSVLVNNAGIQTHSLFVDMSEEMWDETMNINLKSSFWTCKYFVPGMIENGFGRIVNISSMSARRGSYLHTHYCASKAGLVGFTRALSIEIARYGITVNAICPGIVDTDIVQFTLAKKRDVWLNEMHVKRLGTPGDIANALEFLVREESSWVTGQALDINGGILTP